MSVKCKICGLERTRICDHCGDVAFGVLRIVSQATGKSITFSTAERRPLGRTFLRNIAGEEAVYASEPQFFVYKDHNLRSWVIETAPAAVNPTHVDGRPLGPLAQPLKTGSVISIKDKMPLEVKLEGLEEYG